MIKHLLRALLLTACAAHAAGVYNYFPPSGITYGLGTGLSMGSAIGGPQGPGTINAQGVYVNGVAVATGGSPGGTNGAIQYNNGGAFGGFVVSGDCTINTTTGVETCLSTNGVSFGTAATTNTGTSGATIPLLNGANTWSATQGFAGISASSITDSGITGSTQCVHASSVGLLTGTGSDCGSGGGSSAWSSLTSGTNTTMAALIGTGASLGVSGTGTIGATSVTGLSVASGKTLTANNSLTLAGTDATTMTFPGTSQTLAGLGTAQTWTALQKFTNADLALLGGSTGYTLLESSLSGASNNTLSLPTTTNDTLAAIGTAQTWTAAQTFPQSGLKVSGSSTGVTTLASANASATGYTITLPAANGTVSLSGAALLQSGIPFIQASSGTIGNNCAISALTALQTTYSSGAYIYLPANAISSGSSAGWYYFVGSSTTAGTCFNNVYTTGTPTIPGSPTAFSTTHSGGYTQTAGSFIQGPNVSVPAGSLGVNGKLGITAVGTNNNSAGTKEIGYNLGGSTNCSINFTTTLTSTASYAEMYNRGTASAQVYCFPTYSNGNSNALIFSSVNTGSAQTFSYELELSTATDYQVVESYSVSEYPN